MKSWLRRAYLTHTAPRYLGTIAIVSGLILTLFLLNAGVAAVGAVSLLLVGLLALVPALDLAIVLVNRSVMAVLGPLVLPRLALRDGAPSNLRTLVVMPTLLTGQAQIEEQVERLEVHYLANSEGDLRFALLSDWTDAPLESMSGDDELLAATVEGIARLNRRHGPAPDGGERFLLFHRRRGWDESERKWIGWERKRGKLHELNRLLRGATGTTFLPIGGLAPRVPSGIRYVITLDADTRLPRGAACRLVATMAHPSIGRSLTRVSAESLKDTLYCSRASRRRSLRIATDRCFRKSSRAHPALTRTPLPSPTSTRTFSARGLTSGKRSTTSMHSRRPWPGGCQRMPC